MYKVDVLRLSLFLKDILNKYLLDVVPQASNFCTWEAEAEGTPIIQVLYGLQSETQYKTKNKTYLMAMINSINSEEQLHKQCTFLLVITKFNAYKNL